MKDEAESKSNADQCGLRTNAQPDGDSSGADEKPPYAAMEVATAEQQTAGNENQTKEMRVRNATAY